MFRWSAIFMIIAILAITGFQVYWMKNNYDREKQNFDIKTSAAFRQTITKLQASKLKLEQFNISFNEPGNTPDTVKKGAIRLRSRWKRQNEPTINILNILQEKLRDSLLKADTANRVPLMIIKAKDGDPVFTDSIPGRRIMLTHRGDSLPGPEMIREVHVNKDKNKSATVVTVDYSSTHDETNGERLLPGKGIFIERRGVSNTEKNVLVGRAPAAMVKDSAVYRFLYNIDSLSIKDSVSIDDINKAYAARLKEDNINVQFAVQKLDSTAAGQPNTVTVGFIRPVYFGYTLQHTFKYMFDKLKLPLLFSILLLGFTIASFVLLYRNMIKQQRLAALKNDFISNISHELKTPIATASVAIEALRNFNAIDDPERTKEYLSISQNELQRLDLLVDKVLKLSIFEKKAIELRKEEFDLRKLAEEIITTLRVQFEKYQAQVSLVAEGNDFNIEADKLHITSVLYNLLDNALKYGGEKPVIGVTLVSGENNIELRVKDSGIGIPAEYKTKVFEKFFRVPTGDRHNIKGYGLGLSYVSEVVKRHHGSIRVESGQAKGSEFIVNLPRKES